MLYYFRRLSERGRLGAVSLIIRRGSPVTLERVAACVNRPPSVFAFGRRRKHAGISRGKDREGATADVHAWAPGQIVKLFKAGDSSRLGRHEARMTRAAFAAGGPAPEVLDEVTLEGRFGIVLPRFDGPTLLQLLLARAMTYEEVGATLATLYISVHKTPPPPGVVFLRDWIDAASRRSGDLLLADIAAGVLTLIDRLPPGNGLCHTDLHPGNVIMTTDGPRIIDWACAVRAPRRLRHRALPCHAYRARPGGRRSGATPRHQCRRAVRVCAAGRRVPSGVDGDDAAVSAYPARLRPPPAAADQPRPARAADPAHRESPAFGGLVTADPGPSLGGRRPHASSVAALGRFSPLGLGPKADAATPVRQTTPGGHGLLPLGGPVVIGFRTSRPSEGLGWVVS